MSAPPGSSTKTYTTYLILRETPWGTPTLTVAPRMLCRLIFRSAPYSTTVPKKPDLRPDRKQSHIQILIISLVGLHLIMILHKSTNVQRQNILQKTLFFENVLYWALNLCLVIILELILVAHHHKCVRNAELQMGKENKLSLWQKKPDRK